MLACRAHVQCLVASAFPTCICHMHAVSPLTQPPNCIPVPFLISNNCNCVLNHVSNVMQISVYGRSRLSQDVFLGEVLIPLREVEETGASGVAEVHKYILGRRSTKERVSGEISLACSWRVTPLDVVIMKVSLNSATV